MKELKITVIGVLIYSDTKLLVHSSGYNVVINNNKYFRKILDLQNSLLYNYITSPNDNNKINNNHYSILLY